MLKAISMNPKAIPQYTQMRQGNGRLLSSGKETKMDKDINKYVEEFMKSQSRQELSDDAAALAVGGGAPLDFYCFRGANWESAGRLLQNVLDRYGEDVAIEWANEFFGQTTDWETYIKASRGSNAGYYACSMISEKIYNGGF